MIQENIHGQRNRDRRGPKQLDWTGWEGKQPLWQARERTGKDAGAGGTGAGQGCGSCVIDALSENTVCSLCRK